MILYGLILQQIPQLPIVKMGMKFFCCNKHKTDFIMTRELSQRMEGMQITCCPRKPFMDVTRRDVAMGRNPQGGGIISTALAAGKLASNLIFGPVGAKVSNVLTKAFNKNPAARNIFPGEQHILLPTKFGVTRANYAGPNTRLQTRLARGDIGVDGTRGIDSISRRHDMAYDRARTFNDVKLADTVMINEVRKSSAGKRTKQVVIAALRAKKLGEKIGVFGPNTFTQVTEDDNIKEASGAGFIGGPNQLGQQILPSDRLLKAVMKRFPNKRKRKRNVPREMGGQYRGSGPILDAALPVIKEGAKTIGKKVILQVIVPLLIARITSFLQSRFKKGTRKRKRKR